MKRISKKQTKKEIKGIYNECFNFLKSSKNYIYWTIILFIIFIIIGYFSNIPSSMEAKLLDMLKKIAEGFAGLNICQTIWKIFSNNLTVSFLAIALGVMLGFFPLLLLMSNGILIGYVARKAVSLDGIVVLWKLFPHGIFELPAVLISMALGIKLGFQIFKKGAFKSNLRNSFYVFCFIVLPLLAIAAIIEGILVFMFK